MSRSRRALVQQEEEAQAMKSTCSLRIFQVAIVAIACVTGSLAQKAGNAGPKYDVANQVKIKGVVDDVKETPGAFEGTQLVVKTDTGTVLVAVAPADFLKEMDASFKKGDQVEVVGAKYKAPEGDEVLAREITIGNNTTTLRDDTGIPVWVGWKAPKK
jgi:DNA/RNA endonuclease YhcR with UshA esterase domain